MAVLRVHKSNNYTVMANYHFKERNMTLKAKGLLSLMLSLPNDWDYSIMGLVALSKDGKDSVIGALKELESFGYLKRTRIHNDKGQITGYDYDIYESPIENKEKAEEIEKTNEEPYAEKPHAEKPHTVKPPQVNTNYINNTKKVSKKKIKKDKIDKREVSPSIPSSFTKELIKCGYVENDSLEIGFYNDIFTDLLKTYEFELVRACLYYFTQRVKSNGKKIEDENGKEIENRLAYFRTAIIKNTKLIDYQNNMREKSMTWLDE